MCIGGPALVYYVTPTEEELFKVSGNFHCNGNLMKSRYLFDPDFFKRYNPDLQRRSLENRHQRQQDFDNFVGKLKEYSKSNKTSKSFISTTNIRSSACSVWEAAAEDEAATRAKASAEEKRLADEAKARSDEIRKQAMSGK